MGLYLRKAFRFGPLRLNLSKSGLGISAGVTGFRLGAGPRGTYLHAGRGGLYVREFLGASPRAHAIPDRTGSPVASNPPSPRGVTVTAKRYGSLAFLPLLLGILFAFVMLGAGVPVLAAIVAAAGVVLSLAMLWADTAYQRRLSAYTSRVLALFQLTPPLPAGPTQVLLRLRQEGHFRPEHLQAIHFAGFRALLEAIMEDGVIADVERQQIAKATSLLGLCREDAHSAKVEAFRRHYLACVSDRDLTPEEEARLDGFRAALAIPPEAVRDELAMLTEFRAARRIRDGKVSEIPVDITLQQNEVCYHRTLAQVLETRALRSYTMNRVRHKEEGLVPTKAGTLYVTSKRLLLVGNGATAYSLRKVLDVEVDPDAKRITVTLDGRQRPIVLAVPDPLITGAHIDHLSQD